MSTSIFTNKRWRLVYAFAPVIAITGLFFITRGAGQSTPRPPDNSLSKPLITIKPKDISVSANTAIAPGGDVNQNKQMDGGDTLRFSFTITNHDKGQAQFLSLRTGLDKNTVFNISHVMGTTGLDSKPNELTLSNILVQSNQTQIISFDATLIYSQNPSTISLNPQLFDPSNQLLTKGVVATYTIGKNSPGEIPNSSKVTSNGG